MINLKKLKTASANWLTNTPFPHFIIDNFFEQKVAKKLETEFPNFKDNVWYEYKIVGDQIGCPTYAQDLAKTIIVILKRLNNSLASGIFHYCGKDPCSWYEFAKVIFREANLAGLKTRSSIHFIRSAAYPLAISRPLFSVLECSKIKNTFDIDPSDWKLGVKKAISNYISLITTKNKSN